MALTNTRSKRKITGGRYISYRKKKVKETRNLPALTKIGKTVKRLRRTLGGNKKQILLNVEVANVYNPKTKKMQVVKINSVVENKANRHFVRRNIITKGTILDTELGKAKVTSRPGQEGAINAVLI
jgi:small subunit ribosomal protein S8e